MTTAHETIAELKALFDQSPTPIPFQLAIPPTPWQACFLPDGMREAAEAIAEHVQAPIALAGFSVISAIAHLAQRIADAEHPEGGNMPCSLFALVLADSGDRKSACFRLASQPINEAEQKNRQHYKQQCEAILADNQSRKKTSKDSSFATLPKDPRTLYREGTVEAIARDMILGGRPAMSLSTDEGGQFFGGHSMKSDTRTNACGMLTRLFDGNGVERNRVGADSGSGYRYGVRFSMFMAAQPIAVKEALNDPLLKGQGLLARFLFSAPESLAGSRFTNREKLSAKANDNPALKAYWATLGKMYSQPWQVDEHDGLELSVAEMNEEAREIWITFYNDIEGKLKPTGELVCIKPFAQRGGEIARRLAIVFAVWRHIHENTLALEVDGTDMQRATLVVTYSLQEWHRQQGGNPLSAIEQDALILLKAMQKQPERWQGISRSFIGQHCPIFLRQDCNRRNAAISELMKRHWLYDDGTGLKLMNA